MAKAGNVFLSIDENKFVFVILSLQSPQAMYYPTTSGVVLLLGLPPFFHIWINLEDHRFCQKYWQACIIIIILIYLKAGFSITAIPLIILFMPSEKQTVLRLQFTRFITSTKMVVMLSKNKNKR